MVECRLIALDWDVFIVPSTVALWPIEPRWIQRPDQLSCIVWLKYVWSCTNITQNITFTQQYHYFVPANFQDDINSNDNMLSSSIHRSTDEQFTATAIIDGYLHSVSWIRNVVAESQTEWIKFVMLTTPMSLTWLETSLTWITIKSYKYIVEKNVEDDYSKIVQRHNWFPF